MRRVNFFSIVALASVVAFAFAIASLHRVQASQASR